MRIFNKYLAKRTILIDTYGNRAIKIGIGFLSFLPPLSSPKGSKFQLHWNCGYYILVLLFAFGIFRKCEGITELFTYLISNSAEGFCHLYSWHLYFCYLLYIYIFLKFLCGEYKVPTDKILNWMTFFFSSKIEV